MLAEAYKIAGLEAWNRMSRPEVQAGALSTMVAETPTVATVATA